MIYNAEEKIAKLEECIVIEKDKIERLQKELCDWTLSEKVFVNKRKVLNSAKTFIKKLEKDLALLNNK